MHFEAEEASMKYLIDKRENISPRYLEGMHKLRASIFKDKKGWDVSIIADMEIDGYDALAPTYMLLIDDINENKVACLAPAGRQSCRAVPQDLRRGPLCRLP